MAFRRSRGRRRFSSRRRTRFSRRGRAGRQRIGQRM